MNITIGHRIRVYRERHRLTQEEFGKRLGVSRQAISKWERQECYPDITLFPSLARLLGCDIRDFFEKDSKTP